MALFGRKKREQTEALAVGLAGPVVVQEGDVEHVRQLMTQFNLAIGSDAGIRKFGVDLNRAGGFISDVNTVRAVQQLGPDALQRPWLWLAAVARQALAQGDRLLVAQIALMAQFWDQQIAPNFTAADAFDGIVDTMKDPARAQLFSVALEALPALPADTVVMENPTGTLRVGEVLILAYAEGLRVQELVDPSTLASARELLGR